MNPSPPDWFERYRDLVADWPAFMQCLRQPLSSALWCQSLDVTPARLVELAAADGLKLNPDPALPLAFRCTPDADLGRRWWYRAGLAHAQEIASQLPVHLLDPKPGERVLDLCAAPGGKTAQIAVRLEGLGTVVANDLVTGRLKALKDTLERLGLANVSVTNADGAGIGGAAGGFDRVLVDAPCSCEGTVRRAPLAAGTSQAPRYGEFARRQIALLSRGAALCRPGGRIVYATCTFAPEENEAVVDAVLRLADGALRVVPASVPGFVSRPGLDAWEGHTFDASLRTTLRVWPEDNDTGGFYVAVLEKAATARGPELPGPITAIDDEGFIAAITERYGLPNALTGAFLPVRATGRGLSVIARDHRPPRRPEPIAFGQAAVKRDAHAPVLRTAGARLWGRQATRNVVELDAGGRDLYLARESADLGNALPSDCDARGVVIVRHAGFALGLGWYDRAAGVVHSLLPKHRAVSEAAPD